MSQNRPQILNTLTDLFLASGGEVGHFCAIPDSDLAVYEELLHYRLAVLESYEQDEQIHWTAALTEDGKRFFLDYNNIEEEDIHSLPIRETITLTFNLRESSDVEAFQQIRPLVETGELIPLLNQLLQLHNILETNDLKTLLDSFPEFATELHAHVRSQIEAQQEKRDQQQMAQLLDEIEAVKALLAQQQPDAPAPAPNGLRPVIPAKLEGDLKRLKVPQFEVPSYEEEEDGLFVVQPDVEAGRRAAENFIKSLLSLQDHEP